MQDRRGEIGSADATSSISPKVFLFASFLELSNQLLAEVLARESALVEDREAPYLSALGLFGEMADSSRRGTELLEQGAERFLCFCRVMIPVGSIPYRGQNCKVLRPGSVGFPEDGGDFFRGVVEHIERFGEHHAGNAEGVANVR